MKRYNETEVFIFDELNIYMEKIDLIINNIIKECDIKNNEYFYLSKKEITDIYIMMLLMII